MSHFGSPFGIVEVDYHTNSLGSGLHSQWSLHLCGDLDELVRKVEYLRQIVNDSERSGS
jgi:hypothetical protein